MPKPRPAAPAAAPSVGAAAAPAVPDPALERLRLYLLRLDPAAAAERPARLAAIAARLEARLAGRPPEERAALLLAEARARHGAPPAAPALPAEAPAAMPEAPLRYHRPLAALRARLLAPFAAPARKPARGR
jgi:hypothetical protein